jgi:proline iminopeptidase
MTQFARLLPPMVALVLQAVSGQAQAAGPPVREGYLDAGGVRLFYRVAGAAPDTLVVLHGGPGFTLDYLADDLLPLADRHTLIFYDQRGTGRSSLVSDSAALDGQRFAEDLEAVRRHFRLERVALLGHSWGAGIAAMYAARYPERIGRLIIVGGIPLQRSLLTSAFDALAAGRDSGTRRQMQQWREARLANPGDAAACRAYYVLWFTPFFVDPAAARRSKGDFCAGSPESLRNKVQSVDRFTMASLGEWDWRAPLRTLKAPVLVIHGSRDVLPLEGAHGWATVPPDARLLLLDNVGHFPYLEVPDRFFTAVHDFLEGQWPAGRVPTRN